MDSSLEYYEVPFCVSFYGHCFEVYFVLYEYCYPSFSFLSICLVYFFFQPFSFSLCRSFVQGWVSCRQHICGSCFLIQSAILCVLIGAFNPLIFKAIIDMYLFISSSLYLFPSLTFFLSLKGVPLVNLVGLVWWRCILSVFFGLGISLLCLPF
ncbi:hypothetical protein HJG60_009000 [Phyllostomus discolor]|uniref:Uncharacterized protein n=1 Tax=Phyllostomus discolor TaxID=89673 RepID=A0A834DH30_9CHIR|nr:hypothetical protein HJG60_009000 [Phyllostomus discolor]